MYEFEDITPTMPHNLCFVRKARTRYFDIKAMLTCYYGGGPIIQVFARRLCAI